MFLDERLYSAAFRAGLQPTAVTCAHYPSQACCHLPLPAHRVVYSPSFFARRDFENESVQTRLTSGGDSFDRQQL
jgi:hypothetical protein